MKNRERRVALQREKLRSALDGLGTRDFRPGNPVMNAAIFHGLHETSQNSVQLADTLYDKGFNVLACDFPHIAPDTKKKTGMSHFDRFLDFFVDYVLEKSMGSVEELDNSLYMNQHTVASFDGLIRIGKVLAYELLNSRSRGKYPTVLIGYSNGALTILRLLQSYPALCKRIHAVVCISAPLRVDHNINKKLQKSRWLIEPFLEIIIRRRPNILVGGTGNNKSSESALSLETRKRLTAYVAAHIYWNTLDMWKQIERLEVNTLFFHGIHDRVAPLDAVKEAVVRMPKGFRREIYEYNCGHDIFTRFPNIKSDVAYRLKETLDKK